MTPTRYAPAFMAAAALLAAVLAAAQHHDACETAQQAFSECVPYVVGEEPAVSPSCCRGLGDISDMGDTAAQRGALCACILSEVKAAAGGRMAPGRTAGLAASCKVPIGFIPTKPDFNCSTVL
ncbi:unnamed protein product [Urochloa decumbens]|uniref:Non-specific lipid-transfer protein n=1 Tax=Urochloa decumbens TaxID=240449 RepID=A0ABC9E6C3_9POAL